MGTMINHVNKPSTGVHMQWSLHTSLLPSNPQPQDLLGNGDPNCWVGGFWQLCGKDRALRWRGPLEGSLHERLDWSHIVYQCQESIYPLKKRFYASLIIIKNNETPKGLAMINDAAMPWQLTVKPSYNTSASTNRGSSWKKCDFFICPWFHFWVI